jgi:hypothetical protein
MKHQPILFLAFLLCACGKSAASNVVDKTPTPPQREDRMGIISATQTGDWKILEDQDHKALGLKSISQTAEYIEIKYTKACEQIFSVTATPNDMLGRLGVSVGASLALDAVRVYIYDHFGRIATPSDIKEAVNYTPVYFYLNVWCE